MKRLFVIFLSLAAASLASNSYADILVFEGFGDPAVQPTIPQDYGDRITELNDPVTGYVYGAGNGPTPNVTVEYLVGVGFTEFNLWNGYGDLTGALGNDAFGVDGEIVLNADTGFEVVLNTFDIAPWANDRDGIVRVLDGDDNVLYDSGVVTFSFSSHWSYSDSALIAPTLRIQSFSADNSTGGWGDLGLDNVNFDQTAVPEPSSGLLLAGLMSAGIFCRRKAR